MAFSGPCCRLARPVRAGMHDRNQLKRSAAATVLQRAMTQAVNPHDAPCNIIALRDNEIEFRRLVAGLTDHAICLLGIDGLVLSWNNGAERIYGYRSDEIIDQHFHFSRFYTPE